MKTIYLWLIKACALIVILLAGPVDSLAQLNLGINYQAVIRDSQGDPMVNQAVTLEFRIRYLCSTCPITFTDVHNTTTNEHGLVAVVIGTGTTSDDLNDINFANTNHFLQVLVNGSNIGTQRLEAVPSSLKATNMELGELVDVSISSPTNGQVLQWNGTDWGPGAVSGVSPWIYDSNGISYDADNVGIGGSSDPAHKVEITSGNNSYTMLGTNNYTGASNRFGLVSVMNSGGTGSRHALYGSAGAPSSGSASIFGVYGTATQGTSASPAYGIYGSVSGSGTGDRWAGYFNGPTKVSQKLEVGTNFTYDPTGFNAAGLFEMRDNDGTASVVIHGNRSTTTGAEMFMSNDAGTQTIQLDADYSTFDGGYLALKDQNGNARIELLAKESAGQAAALYLFNNSNVRTIELDADFGGNGRVITDELQIKGGSDLAEMFSTRNASVTLEPGSVVVIDTDDPGSIKLATKANDRMVVGVVSGANGVRSGMLMGQEGSEAYGDIPVAIVGRVYVKADQTNGVILPGDLLTSSTVPGHAMKVNTAHAVAGSILGKALTAIDENGFVLLLVNLR